MLVRAALAVSREVVLLYWQIGQEIRERQARHGWGAKVVQQLAADLKSAFPGVEGFSRTNLLYMRAFAEAYPDAQIVQQLLDDSPLPWGHHIRVLDKVKDTEQRLWCIRAAHEHGWSRAILEHQIETNLFGRQGKALTNFSRTLPPPDSDLAHGVRVVVLPRATTSRLVAELEPRFRNLQHHKAADDASTPWRMEGLGRLIEHRAASSDPTTHSRKGRK